MTARQLLLIAAVLLCLGCFMGLVLYVEFVR